jgi:hypothetical protein
VAQQTVDDGHGHDVPLRLYVERIFDEREKALALALTAQLKVFERYDAELETLKDFRSRALGFSVLLAFDLRCRRRGARRGYREDARRLRGRPLTAWLFAYFPGVWTASTWNTTR